MMLRVASGRRGSRDTTILGKTMKMAAMARLLGAATSRLCMAALALTVGAQMPAVAQNAQERKAAEELLRAGVKAQEARQHDQAVQQFSQAINSGALARKQMGFALYRRGVSHRIAKRPAQAISDLNSALFFEGALSSSDRAAALKERNAAYKDAGLQPTAVATGAARDGSATGGSAAQSAAQAVVPRRSRSTLPPTEPILGGPSASRVSGRAAQPQAIPAFEARVAASPRSPSAPTARSAPTSQPQTWAVATKPAAAAQAAPAATAVRTAQQSAWSSPEVVRANAPPASQAPAGDALAKGVSSFFSSLLGGGQPAAEAGRPVVTSSVRREAVVAEPPSAAGAGSVAAGAIVYDIGVATVRDKGRAEALAKRLMRQYGSSASWDGKQARVETFPSKDGRGPLYSVRLGSYTDRGAMASQCEKLIADGHECQVIRRR